MSETRLPDELLARLAQLTSPEAQAELEASSLLDSEIAGELASVALANAAVAPEPSGRWLDLADIVNQATGDDRSVQAQILYARARLHLVTGDMVAAETTLRAAQEEWQRLGDRLSLTRSSLGLTQLLAMQGRYDEAEATMLGALDALAPSDDPAALLVRLDVRQNLATVLSYQERFSEALVINTAVRADLLALLLATAGDDAAGHADLQQRLGMVERDLALAYTYLDRTQEAEDALQSAVERQSEAGAELDRGQTRANLGHLFSRTGRYAEALAQLDAATLDLLGTVDVDAASARWPAADVLFLEQATVYLALNLLPEAEAALNRATQLFQRTEQRYELGQAHYYAGLLKWQRGDAAGTATSLAEAAAIFVALDNAYWLHRVRLAQAGLALRTGELAVASQVAADLFADEQSTGTQVAVTWDQVTRIELHLLRLQIGLSAGNLAGARQAAASAADGLGLASLDSREPVALPNFHLRLLHGAGQIERTAGNPDRARQFFTRAIERLEEQRAMLPVEELRTAFLTDKTAIYTDLVLSLLDMPAPDDDTVAAAFAVVERARSRALLERMLTSVADIDAGEAGLAPEAREQMAEMRRQLYWLYNQLLGGTRGSRRVAPTLTQEIQAREAALQQMEWHAGALLADVQPVALSDLQRMLGADQQAVVYYLAGDEVMAFVVASDGVQVVRHLCQTAALEAAQADLRFQLGRVEIGADYLARHHQRLLAGVRNSLHRLYDLVLSPLGHLLTANRLLLIPHGMLHLLPFHALWDGEGYLVDAYEITYASSASIVVHRRQSDPERSFQSLAALAVHDVAIPQATAEAHAAATHFDRATLYLDDEAGLAGLRSAASNGDVLHIATHGLFRPDNPFFSALKLADGWIDVREIYRLPLRARLVVLSACESGAVQVQGSDEAIGLVRGFLGAGAETLVVSLWNVHDASAASLMDTFYTQLTDTADQGPASALRKAQNAAIADGRHPYYWAPYVVVGQ